jgi:NAD(P)H-hydrate epimerase
MYAITGDEMRACEESLFAQGVTAEELMEQAGRGIAQAVRKFFPQPGILRLYLGKGHNAGDALCAARHLKARGWRVELRCCYEEIEWATLTRKQARLLELQPQMEALDAGEHVLLIDSLLGIGSQGALREPIAEAVREICRLRSERGYRVVAMDLPTGLNADDGSATEAVVADYTFTIGALKRGLLAASAVNFVGRVELIPLEGIAVEHLTAGFQGIEPRTFGASLPLRAHDFHKGDAGRVAVIAGSLGIEGAAIMAAAGALRGGAGLVTLWVRGDCAASIKARVMPEVMVRVYADFSEIDVSQADAIVFGPGLGKCSAEDFVAWSELLGAASCPAVIDADGLNAISEHQGHHVLQARHVITPHPGEFARLAPHSSRRGREEGCRHFAEHSPAVILLKGARTLVTQRGEDLYANLTGHAGMASAGMGDVLAGVIGALLGQGLTPLQAACCGAWSCGRAAESAMLHQRRSQESLLATDLLQELGGAFEEWRASSI